MEVSFPEPRAHSALNNWLAEVRYGDSFALPSRWEVFIDSPAGGNSRKVSMRCESVDLPGRALNTSLDPNMYEIAPEIVDGITFGGTIALTIQASNNLEERVYFEAWQEEAWDRGTWNVKYYKEYVKPMEIYILDQTNFRKYGIKLFECFPKEIGPTQLSSDAAGDIIKIPVTMQYKYWETIDQKRPAKAPWGGAPDVDSSRFISAALLTGKMTAAMDKLANSSKFPGAAAQKGEVSYDYTMPGRDHGGP